MIPRVSVLKVFLTFDKCILFASTEYPLPSLSPPPGLPAPPHPGHATLDRKPETFDAVKKGDTVIVVAPGPRAEWASCVNRFKEQKVKKKPRVLCGIT